MIHKTLRLEIGIEQATTPGKRLDAELRVRFLSAGSMCRFVEARPHHAEKRLDDYVDTNYRLTPYGMHGKVKSFEIGRWTPKVSPRGNS